VDLLTLLRPWLEGKSVSIAAPARPAAAEDTLRSTFDIEPLPSASTAASASPTVTTASPVITSTKEERPAAPAGSIVEQIDSILQTRLLGTALGNRGIYLAQSLEGGVIVYVGTASYKGVDEVPEAEVKAAIRGAIQEWENKYTPGL
jgi:hypothetical protein